MLVEQNFAVSLRIAHRGYVLENGRVIPSAHAGLKAPDAIASTTNMAARDRFLTWIRIKRFPPDICVWRLFFSENYQLIPRAQFVLFLELYPRVKEQNLYTRWLLRSRAYLAARLFRASARW